MNREKVRTTYGKLIYILQVGDIALSSFSLTYIFNDRIAKLQKPRAS